MSLGNQGIFQLLKEVSFRGILAFYNYRKWDHIPKDDRQSLYLTAMFHKQEKQRNHCNTSRNIDIGKPSRAFPVTPPGIRVRTTAVRLVKLSPVRPIKKGPKN
jgi:hypothetical protein